MRWNNRKTTTCICWRRWCRTPRWARTPWPSGYQELNQEAHAGLDACGGRAQGQSALAKMNTRVGIGIRTLTDRSTRNLAGMLSEGSSQGVMDCIKCQKDYPGAAPGTRRLMQRLQAFEEDNRQKLQQFL